MRKRLWKAEKSREGKMLGLEAWGENKRKQSEGRVRAYRLGVAGAGRAREAKNSEIFNRGAAAAL